MDFSLSISWNAFRHEDGEKLLFEIKDLGFKEIELSFNLTPEILKGIRIGLKKYGLGISSVHNYCPIPVGLKREEALPDCYSMSSLDPEERRSAVTAAKISIDTAASFNARAVVLHCGRVEIADRTKDLINLYTNGLKGTIEYLKLKNDIMAERDRKYEPYLKNTLLSLEELSNYAKDKNVFLGVETRFYHREIPSLEETGIILEKFKGANIFYWHDIGHAQVMENLGFYTQKECLELYGKNLLGVHLHDVKGCHDHLAPSKGEIGFALIKPYLQSETIKVIEAHHPATAEDIKSSKEFLEKIFA